MANLMTIEEAANYLGIRLSTLYKYTSARKIPHVKVGRLVKFRQEDLENWVNERFVKPIRQG
ncbi:MAG: helix-turn-helix domain-containing protein [Candidatus Sifarchaeia archaeon]